MNIRKYKIADSEIRPLLTDNARDLFDNTDYTVLYQKYNDQYRLVGYHENDYMVKDTTLENIAEILEQDYLDYLEYNEED